MKVGLTLGKFAPLHRGHQLVIETALKEMDRVVVLVYPAAEINTPLTVRADWIRELYPSVEVVPVWDGVPIANLRSIDESFLARLRGLGVTHFYCSDAYGEPVSRALGVIDRRVDMKRERVPITTTTIRSDAFTHRRHLDPLVYRDLIARVVFVGAMSTGKTTLAQSLAEQYRTVWMPEYGREYWEKFHVARRLTPSELTHIGEEHRLREEKIIGDARRFLFVDTEAIVTRLFARYYHGGAEPRLEQLANESPTHYDLFFLCDDDMPYADTEDRSGEANRTLFQLWLRDELAWRKVPYLTLSGNVDQRMETATRVLEKFEKYKSLAGIAM